MLSCSKLPSAPVVSFSGAVGNCEVSVYAAVDVSGSMAGPKAIEVCEALQRIIDDCPDNVLFDITLFSTTTWKAATALKSGLNMHKLAEEIKTTCERDGMTALYDAWGDMLTSIPKAAFKNGNVQIFVLTDGGDNRSTKYDAKSIVQLTKSIVGGNAKFDFIQVGKDGNAGIVDALKTLNASTGKNVFRSLVVDDSANGIRSAMSTVHKDIMLSTTKGKSNPGNSTLKASGPGNTTGPTRNSSSSSSRAAGTLPSVQEATLIQSFSAADMMSTRKIGSSSNAANSRAGGSSSSQAGNIKTEPGKLNSSNPTQSKTSNNSKTFSSTSSTFRLQ